MLSVIVPSYNEEENIPVTADRIHQVLAKAGLDHEILFVDDGSTDGTYTAITGAAGRIPQVRGLKLSRNFGKEAAIMAGLAQARGNCCALIDCDLQHPPECLPEMVKLWRQGYLIVEGIKKDRGRESLLYRVFAHAFYKLISGFTRIDFTNASDYKLLDRRIVDILLALPEKNRFFRGLSVYYGFPKAQVTFEVQPRKNGGSRWKTSRLIRYAFDNISSFSSFPLQITTGLGGLMFLLFILLGAHTLYNYVSGHAVEGFTTVILLLLFIGSVLALGLGVIGHYIAKIYDEVKGRPVYILEKTTDQQALGRPGFQAAQEGTSAGGAGAAAEQAVGAKREESR